MTIDLIHVIAAAPLSVALGAVIAAVILAGEYLLGR
jgi:hypothetical protein